MIPTRRRLEYASGYLTLGLLKDAAAELAWIKGDAARSAEVLRLKVSLGHHTRRWGQLIEVAAVLAKVAPEDEQGWISWAYALRELGRVAEAQDVLRQAEPLHGESSAVLHYNLACYACLLGDRAEARRRLAMACALDAEFKSSALTDPDFEAMRDELSAPE